MKSDLHEDVPENDDTDIDEEIDAASQGDLTSLEGGLGDEEEIDAIGEAAGLRDDPEKPFEGIAKKDRRDEKRWELDPDSKERQS